MVRFMLYFFLSKNVKKKWEKLFLARIKMKLSFVAVCEERYILIWNFLHCQYLNYQTTKCYLMLWKISSEIGPFFKDNLLPVNIRARECHCQCLSIMLFHCDVLCCLNTDAVCRPQSNCGCSVLVWWRLSNFFH